MTIVPYIQQLKDLAALERVNLYDAIRYAGVSRWTYDRMIKGKTQLRAQTAEQIADAIKDLSAR